MVALIETAALLAQSAGDLKDNTKNLIFIGVFFIALIIVAIWWLRRG